MASQIIDFSPNSKFYILGSQFPLRFLVSLSNERDFEMADEEDKKATASRVHVKDLIRQLQTLSPEDRALVEEALQQSVRPKTQTMEREPAEPTWNFEPAPTMIPQMPLLAIFLL